MTPAERFLAALEVPTHVDRVRCATWLGDRMGDLARHFPGIRLDFAGFGEHLAKSTAGAADVLAALTELHFDDLFLAWAAAEGDPSALAIFEREHLARVPLWARGTDPSELSQVVRVRLLLADSGEPAKIRQYTGRGPLSAWVRMVATRAAIDLSRASRAATPPPDIEELASAHTATDPEIDYLKSRYAANFRAALESALASLSPKEATLLKLCYLENTGPQAIGRMYSVSPRTAQRWLVAARDTLLAHTRTALAAELSVRPTELDSLMLLVDSQLHVTLERVLDKRAAFTSVHESEQ